MGYFISGRTPWPHALAASVYLIVSTGKFHCMRPSNYFNIDIFILPLKYSHYALEQNCCNNNDNNNNNRPPNVPKYCLHVPFTGRINPVYFSMHFILSTNGYALILRGLCKYIINIFV